MAPLCRLRQALGVRQNAHQRCAYPGGRRTAQPGIHQQEDGREAARLGNSGRLNPEAGPRREGRPGRPGARWIVPRGSGRVGPSSSLSEAQLPAGLPRCEVLAVSFELILPFLRPIEALLLDEDVSEIMGNPDASWFCERDGKLCQEPNISFDAGRLRTGLEVIANQLGKRLDEDNPLLDAHLPDGSRLAAAIPPGVCPAPSLTIKKFPSR